MTREEIRQQWIYDCTVACDNATARLKELEEKKEVTITHEDIDIAYLRTAKKFSDKPIDFEMIKFAVENFVEIINKKNNL